MKISKTGMSSCRRGADILLELLSGWVMAMDQQLNDWRLAVERFCSAEAPDWHAIVRLVADIAASGHNPTLRLASMHAMPSLRNATGRWPDRNAAEIAKRRLAIVLEVLNTLTEPRFGKRGEEARPLTPDERYRRLLGLPLDRSRRDGNSPGVQARGQDGASGCRRQRGAISRAFRRARCLDEALTAGGAEAQARRRIRMRRCRCAAGRPCRPAHRQKSAIAR
jgi:hypothetical protein